MKAVLEGLKALGPARLGAMAAVGLATFALLVAMVLHGGSAPMALLYGDLDLRDSAQAVEQLERAHVPHQLAAGGAQILVPADQVAAARLLLAKEGLPTGGSVGYEIFDHTDTLTANQFQLAIDQTRALEGELARTIRAIRGVRAARVHLVLPRREPFSREPQDAQASVLLTMAGNARMDREGVQAILNLIAAAVPGLKPRNIAIVDSRGDLLARAGEPVGEAAAVMTGEEIRRTTELRLSRAVEEMLERSLGPGHVRAEAAVQMDFDQLRETQEHFDPDGQVVRSQQSTSDNSRNTESTPNVSVQNNLPNADAGTTPAGSQEQRQEDTTNYEISKTVRTMVHDQPQIRRISLAVMVDGETTPGPDGKPVWHERPPEELARITALVRSAIGYDEKRGDKVDVVSLRFAGDGQDSAAAPGLLGMEFEKSDLLHLARLLLFGVLGVVALLMVLRPMVMRLTTLPELTGGAEEMEGALPAMATAGGGSLPAPPLVPGLPAPIGMPQDENMLELANVEGQMRASLIRRITDLVEKHPEDSLAIVRNWMAQEQR